jgi:hypothetical protein
MAIKTSSQSLLSRGSTTTAISGFGGGTSLGGSSTITSISYLAANGVALTANAAPTVSNSLIKIVGTGFTSGANVYLNGLLQPSANVTFVNSTELRLNMPPLTTNTYSLMAFDSTGAGTVYYPGVRFDPYPLWGNTVFNLTTAVSQQLTVTDYGSGSVTFSLASGNTLPSGLTLSANGLMSGTVTAGTYTFYVNAIDSENEISPQQVTLIAVTNISVEYLIVAGGGGGGGNCGGGGGAGGYRTNYTLDPIILAPSTAYTVTVGSGGNGSPTSSPYRGTNGGVSSLVGGAISIESAGGGAGAGYNNNYGNSGGSGGGAGGNGQGNSPARGEGNTPAVSPSQGNPGGYGGSYSYFAGSGGGAGAAGTNANNNSVPGGIGAQNSITGSAIYYAGGGGAGRELYSTGYPGGLGGGGRGSNESQTGLAGTVNTGGGGGGGGTGGAAGGVGGSGVVILRTTSTASGTTGSPTVTTDAGYNVYKFTASGTITF